VGGDLGRSVHAGNRGIVPPKSLESKPFRGGEEVELWIVGKPAGW
jgi:hypothetical protein